MRELGTRYSIPTVIVDSGVIQVIGRESNTEGLRIKMRGSGSVIYWCREVVAGRTLGAAFAVGSDELDKWEVVT